MKNYLVVLLSLIFARSIPAGAQEDVASALKQINSIKVDVNTYLSAESTSAQWEDAYDNAKALLEIKIEEWAKEKAQSEDLTGCIAKAENSILEIKARRGNLYRVFLYVKKSDVMTYTIDKEIVVVPIENSSIREISTINNELPEPPKHQKEQNVNSEERTCISADEKKILSVTSFGDIQNFIESNKFIKDYGKYTTMPSVGKYYVFVYNREGGISAYLKYEDTECVNIKTGKEDILTNYKGCGAFWFRFK